MAVNLVLALSTLIKQSQLEQSPNVCPFTRQSDENGNVRRIILRIFSVGVKVDSPLMTADGEIVTGNVFPDAHALGQRVPLDHESMRAVNRLRDGARAGLRRRGAVAAPLSRAVGGYCWSLRH